MDLELFIVLDIFGHQDQFAPWLAYLGRLGLDHLRVFVSELVEKKTRINDSFIKYLRKSIEHIIDLRLILCIISQLIDLLIN